MLNAIANDNDSHSRAPTPRFAFFHKIGAWAPVRSQYNFDHITQKRVTNLPAKGQVFFLTWSAPPRQCENEVLIRWCTSRRL